LSQTSLNCNIFGKYNSRRYLLLHRKSFFTNEDEEELIKRSFKIARIITDRVEEESIERNHSMEIEGEREIQYDKDNEIIEEDNEGILIDSNNFNLIVSVEEHGELDIQEEPQHFQDLENMESKFIEEIQENDMNLLSHNMDVYFNHSFIESISRDELTNIKNNDLSNLLLPFFKFLSYK